jgi:hypothetical protein
LQRLFVALYVRYGELKKVQRMSCPAVKGNVSCAGEGAVSGSPIRSALGAADQAPLDLTATDEPVRLPLCSLPVDTCPNNQTEHPWEDRDI